MVIDQKNIISKGELRARFKEASFQYLRAPEVSLAIVENIKKILPKDCAIGAFRSIHGEPSLSALFESATGVMAFPKIIGEEIEYFVPHTDQAFELNEFNILEPILDQSDKIELGALSAILVPALAYDRKLNRLGRGKGFYDRLLAGYKGLKIGVCSMVQISNLDLPTDPHDIAMDVVVTDQFILRRFDA